MEKIKREGSPSVPEFDSELMLRRIFISALELHRTKFLISPSPFQVRNCPGLRKKPDPIFFSLLGERET